MSARAVGGCTNNFVYHNLKQHIPELLDLCTVLELVIVQLKCWLCSPELVVVYTRDHGCAYLSVSCVNHSSWRFIQVHSICVYITELVLNTLALVILYTRAGGAYQS